MYRGFLALAGQEVANSARCAAYVRNGVAPVTLSVRHDDSWGWTAEAEGDAPYRLPALDEAPWWDPADDDSMDFAGVWPLLVTGLDAAAASQPVIQSVGDGAGFDVARYLPRTIEVTALLIGATPAGVEYGMRWLADTLRGSRCGDGRGDSLCYYALAPDLDPAWTPEARLGCVESYRREVHRVVTTTSPVVEARFGQQAGVIPGLLGTAEGMMSSACAYRVKFTLTAGVPFAYRPPVLVAEGVNWAATQPRGTVFTVAGADGQCHDPGCSATASSLVDPDLLTAATVVRPVPTLGTVRPPTSTRRTTVTVPAGLMPPQGEAVPIITVQAGDRAERYVRLQLAANPLGVSTDKLVACGACDGVSISYLPAHSLLTLDGVTGRVTVRAPGEEPVDAAGVVFGPGGGPWTPTVLDCPMPYALVCDTAADVDPQVSLGLSLVWRET